jgi:hypothetical protein
MATWQAAALLHAVPLQPDFIDCLLPYVQDKPTYAAVQPRVS